MKQSLGNKIADLRNQKSMTQKELADHCNVDIRTVQRIECGEVVPRTHTLKLLAAALGCDVSYLNRNAVGEKPAKLQLQLSVIAAAIYSINCIPFVYNLVNDSFSVYMEYFITSIHILTYVGFSMGFYLLGTALKNQMISIPSLLSMILYPLLNILYLLKDFYFLTVIGTVYDLVIVNAMIFGVGMLVTGYRHEIRSNNNYFKAAGFIAIIQSIMFMSKDLTITTFGLIISVFNNLIMLAILYTEYRNADKFYRQNPSHPAMA